MITYIVYKIDKENKKRNIPINKVLNVLVFIGAVVADIALLFILCDTSGLFGNIWGGK